MAANQYGVDFGEAFTTAAKINALNAEAGVAERKNAIAGLRSQYAQNPNDETLRQRLLIEDPEGMKQTADAISQMDENQRKRTQGTALELARRASVVMEAPEDQRQQVWESIRSSAPVEIQQAMGDYSPIKVKLMYYNALTVDQLFKNPDVLQFGGNDYVFKNGRQMGDGVPSMNMVKMTNDNQQNALNRKNNTETAGKLNASVITEIRKQAEYAIGGIEVIDPETGKKTIDAGRASQASWVAARSEYYVKKGRPVAQATNQAKRDMDAELEKERKSTGSKPGGSKRPSAKGLF